MSFERNSKLLCHVHRYVRRLCLPPDAPSCLQEVFWQVGPHPRHYIGDNFCTVKPYVCDVAKLRPSRAMTLLRVCQVVHWSSQRRLPPAASSQSYR
ncbi:hypothetical protein J6590_058195 [Homalodisca vitripennis]|nr:hypothetical protein J6590_058195 [Homalodisca vitripennis]